MFVGREDGHVGEKDKEGRGKEGVGDGTKLS